MEFSSAESVFRISLLTSPSDSATFAAYCCFSSTAYEKRRTPQPQSPGTPDDGHPLSEGTCHGAGDSRCHAGPADLLRRPGEIARFGGKRPYSPRGGSSPLRVPPRRSARFG